MEFSVTRVESPTLTGITLLDYLTGEVLQSRRDIKSKRRVSGSPLQRQAFVRVMEIKGLSPRTQEAYLRTIRALAPEYDCAPHLLSGAQVSEWIMKRICHGLHQRTTNAAISALRLFYRDAMKRLEIVEDLWCRRVPDRLPRVIPQEAIDLLLQGISDRRYRMATLLAYGVGLHISEVVALQVEDIKSDLGLIRIRKGKGGYERMAHLPAAVLDAPSSVWCGWCAAFTTQRHQLAFQSLDARLSDR